MAVQQPSPSMTFKVLGCAGTSSHSVVKLAEHPNVRNGVVAIKIIDASAKRQYWRPADANVLRLIEAKVMSLKRLRHPNILQLYDVIDDPRADKTYVVMQHAEKGALFKISPAGTCPSFQMSDVVLAVKQVMSGLRYLHRHGFAHGALQPTNVLQGRDGNIYLSDVGGGLWIISPDGQGAPFRPPRAAATGAIRPQPPSRESPLEVISLGGGHTSLFVAPELWPTSSQHQEAPSVPLMQSADVWALGVLTYCMVAGRVPQHLIDSQMTSHTTQTVSLPIPSGCGDAFKDFIKATLHRDPSQRPLLADLKHHPWILQSLGENAPSHDTSTESLPSLPSPKRSMNEASPPRRGAIVPSSPQPTASRDPFRGGNREKNDKGSPLRPQRSPTPSQHRSPQSSYPRALSPLPAEKRSGLDRSVRLLRIACRVAIVLVRLRNRAMKMLRYRHSLAGTIPCIMINSPNCSALELRHDAKKHDMFG